jgi:phosphatidylglycerol:prolipoprotein diacylglycerol transferase
MEIVRVDQGGLIYYGGLIGASVVFVFFARLHGERVLDLADFAVTALPLGHALGRVGCFLNGCCQGRWVEESSWMAPGLSRYPVQLYEAAFNLIVYSVLFRQYVRRRDRPRGMILASYLMIYPTGRFLLEFMRGDERLRFGVFSAAQYLSLALMVVGMGLWLVVRRQHETVHRNA